MTITGDQADAMAFLSWAAYDHSVYFNDDPLQPATKIITAQNNLDGSGWTALTWPNLNLPDVTDPLPPESFDALGFYVNGPAAALVAEKGDTLSISFRGTDGAALVDLYNAGVKQGDYFGRFQPLIQTLKELIQHYPDKYTELYVSGHSLGGIMAEWFTAEYGEAFKSLGLNLRVSTFGNPGIDNLQFPSAWDQETTDLLSSIVNFGHSQDYVFNNVPQLTGLYRIGSDVVLDVLHVSTPPLLFDEHSSQLYQHSVQLLNESGWLDPLLESPTKPYVIIDEGESSTNYSGSISPDAGDPVVPYLILGLDGNDIISGGHLADTLDGGAGNDRIEGGAGNDIIYGGTGNDTAVYALSLDHYNLSFQTDQVIVSAVFQSPLVYEGVDSVTGIENFQFGTDIYSREKLIAFLNPPAVSPGDTGDQSGATQGGYSGGGAGTVSGGSDVIPGDISSTFVIGANGQPLTSAIETAGDKDYVKVYFVQGDTYRVSMQGDANHGFAPLLDSFFRIRDGQNNVILSPVDAAGGDQLDYTAQYTGWHYISIGAGGSNFTILTGGYSLAVSLINAPVANSNPVANSDTLGVQYGQTITGNVLANDNDPDHDALSVDFLSSFHTTLGGIVDLLPSGVFQYVAPSTGPATIQDSFSYTLRDGAGGTSIGTVLLNLSQPGGSDLFTTGDDYVTVPTGGGTYHALSGNDVVFGSNYSDIIYGDGGGDFLHGLNGNDLLYAGSGPGGLIGGPGDDWLVAGPDQNQLFGDGVSTTFGGFDTADYSELSDSITVILQQGTATHNGVSDFLNDIDQLIGTSLNDFIQVYTSPLLVYGGAGNDTLVGWILDDEFHGGSGDDELQGQDGNDRLFGDDGNDRIDGGAGNNTLDGGAGDDQVSGGVGDDYLFASAGTDRLYGGDGRDTVDYSHAPAGLISFGTVSGWGISTIELIEVFYATPFDDNFGNSMPLEEIHLGSGNDTVNAYKVTMVYGGDGDDFIIDLGSENIFGGGVTTALLD
jgi:Ca2+-binding RTX toxin-like protein